MEVQICRWVKGVNLWKLDPVRPMKRKDKSEIVGKREKTTDNQSCERKLLSEVFKSPKPSLAKAELSNSSNSCQNKER